MPRIASYNGLVDASPMDMAALGAAIQKRRELRGYTRYQLATKAGMSDPYLGTIEEGHSKRIGVAIVARIARALGITTDQLLAEAGILTGPDALPSEMESLYGQLDPITRRAWIRMGHALEDIQAEYAAMQRGERRIAEERYGEPKLRGAAYDQAEEERAAHEDVEDVGLEDAGDAD